MMTRTLRLLGSRIAIAASIGLFGFVVTGCTHATAPHGSAGNQTIATISQSEPASASAEKTARSVEQVGLQENMPYAAARTLLIQQNWRPHEQGDAPDLNDTTVRELFDLGYREVKSCSGTGLGPCRFEFTNAAGDLLVISTIQNGSNNNQERFVWRWSVEENANPNQSRSSRGSNSESPPFTGTRYFNFFGGNGTGQSITIEPDGATLVEGHHTASSSVVYRGQFSNPIILAEGTRLRVEEDTIYQVSASGQTLQNCSDGNYPCESGLYEPTRLPIADGFYIPGGTGQGLEVAGDQYRYYDELGSQEWKPILDLVFIRNGVVFDGSSYWCIPTAREAGVCTESGWQSVQENLTDQNDQ